MDKFYRPRKQAVLNICQFSPDGPSDGEAENGIPEMQGIGVRLASVVFQVREKSKERT
jgi:hypothetical protein